MPKNRHIRLLNESEREQMQALAKQLLLEHDGPNAGQFRKDNFLVDDTGEIRIDAWPQLALLAGFSSAPKNAAALIDEYCTQRETGSRELFHEKGNFMKAVLHLAKGNTAQLEGNAQPPYYLLPIIPIAKCRIHDWQAAPKQFAKESLWARPDTPNNNATCGRVGARSYRAKLAAIDAGETNITLRPGEFLRYALCDRNPAHRPYASAIAHAWEVEMGYRLGHLSSNVFFAIGPLSAPLQATLPTPPESSHKGNFWNQSTFLPTDAAGLEFFNEEKISSIIAATQSAPKRSGLARTR